MPQDVFRKSPGARYAAANHASTRHHTHAYTEMWTQQDRHKQTFFGISDKFVHVASSGRQMLPPRTTRLACMYLSANSTTQRRARVRSSLGKDEDVNGSTTFVHLVRVGLFLDGRLDEGGRFHLSTALCNPLGEHAILPRKPFTSFLEQIRILSCGAWAR